eukprot:gene14662-biopygen11760
MSFYKDLNKIVKSDITKTRSEQLKSPLEVQMKVNSAYAEWLEDIQMDIESPKEVIKGATHIEYHGPVTYIKVSDEASATFGTIEQGTTRTYDTVGTVLENVSGNSEVATGPTTFTSSSLQDVNGDKEAVVSKPQSANAFSGLREKYRKDCSRHEINCVDAMENCIISLDLDINDFSVNLKIVEEEKRCTAEEQTYHDELEKHLHLLKDNAKAIKVGELMNMIEDNEKGRIMFVSGLAGIGKSVLAKKVALDWACSKECSQTRCLLYMTCRELNSFFHESGRDRKPEVLIDEYLKEQFRNMPFDNVETTVFLIDGLDELQEPVKIMKAFTEKFFKSRFIILGRPHARHYVNSIGQKSQKLEILGLNDGQIEEYIKSFVRFSLTEKTSSFDGEEEISYQLITHLGDKIIRHEDESNIVRRALNKLKKSRLHGTIRNKDAQNLIRDILNQLPNDEVQLKMRFLADCFVASDKIRDVKFLEELLKSIKPRSYVEVWLNTFYQSILLSILKLATGNKVANSKIKNAFSGIKFRIDDLREMEILDFALWINIGWVELKDVNQFTKDQSMLVHRNVAFCRYVVFDNCKVPLFTTNANKSTTTMKLKVLRMVRMRIDQSEVSSAANLIGVAEGVGLDDVRVGGKRFEKIMEKVFEMGQRRLWRMELIRCPLVNVELKQKMEENGVKITEIDKRNIAEMATIGLNRAIPAIMDRDFIIISNAPGNQVEAIQIKQKFANEIGCPVFVNIELEKYHPRVVVVLLTDGYEESQQCKEMMKYAKSFWKPKIIAVKLDNDFQPGDELNKISV